MVMQGIINKPCSGTILGAKFKISTCLQDYIPASTKLDYLRDLGNWEDELVKKKPDASPCCTMSLKECEHSTST